MLRGGAFFCATTLVLLGTLLSCQGCNEATCAGPITRCMLMEACKCDLKDYTCLKACDVCLRNNANGEDFFAECCSCLHICPAHTGDAVSSQIKMFPHSNPGLFHVLTEYPDPERWESETFSVFLPAGKGKGKHAKQNGAEKQKQPVEVNCTVAYISNCLSWGKCKRRCGTLGASGCRWFHDGCCECLGDNCVTQGIDESKCSRCPLPDDEDDINNVPDEKLDFGEDMDLDDMEYDDIDAEDEGENFL